MPAGTPGRPGPLDDLGPHLIGRSTAPEPARGLAELAGQLVESDPRRAVGLARALFEDNGAPPELRASAYRAAALASIQLGELAEARRMVEEGMALVEGAGLVGLRGEMSATAAHLWFHAELVDKALAEIERGLSEAGRSSPAARVALHGQAAYIYFRLGRYEEGLAETDATFAELSQLAPTEAASIRARALTNRGLARCYRGSHTEGHDDLAAALELHRAAGAEVLTAQGLHNLGFAATQRGDVPEALSWFDEALLSYLRLGLPLHQLLADRAELLVKARLVPEARQAAAEAAKAFEEAGLNQAAADALAILAEACLADGDLEEAVAVGDEAAAAFLRQHRPHMAALSADVRERALRLGCGPGEDERRLASARRSVASLEKVKRPAASWRARVEGARSALELGRPAEATELLAPLLSEPPAESAQDEAVRLHAEALFSAATGEDGPTLAALGAAMRSAFSQVSGLKSVSSQPGHGALLGELLESALDILLSRRQAPEEALEWVEWARGLANAPAGGLPRRVGADELLAHLGEEQLAELVSHRGRLFCLVALEGRLELAELGDIAPLEKASASLHLAIGELVRPPGRRNREAMAELFLRSVRELDARLGAPLSSLLDRGDRPVRLVPAGPLHDLAWCLLPSLADKPVLLAAGARRGRPAPRAHHEVLLVAGPRLPEAREELERLADLYRPASPLVLAGSRANRKEVLDGLSRAEVVHLAVHGRFRADNPFLSSLELDDGQLSLFEMALNRPCPRPHVVVLSACDAGRVASHASEELAGPVPGLLGFEGGYVIAPVAPVSDEAMVEVSAKLHGELLAGAPPATALSRLRRVFSPAAPDRERWLREAGSEVASFLSAGSLVCHGPSLLPGSRLEMLGESRS